MSREEKRDLRKKEIIEVMLGYKDNNGNIDLSELRKQDSKTYSKISYYFGTIDNALAECGVSNVTVSDIKDKGASLNRKTLRNELAYDMLVQLREKHTLEEIATRYGCSRAHINQLFQALAKTVGANREEDQDQDQAE